VTQLFLDYLIAHLTGLQSSGLYRSEWVIVSKQVGEI